MLEFELPLIARLTVHALGSVHGGRLRQPADPVAAWLIRHRPGLVPDRASAPALATIRARTALVDRMVREELGRPGDPVALWTLGGAFDARWLRLGRHGAPAPAEVWELEEPAILAGKDRLLQASPFAGRWQAVRTRERAPTAWRPRPRTGLRPLIVLEGLAGRLAPDALGRLLVRIRYETPDARAVVGLPGIDRDDHDPWSVHRIRQLGWSPVETVHLGPRGRLTDPEGDELCPGMYPLRLMRLEGKGPV